MTNQKVINFTEEEKEEWKIIDDFPDYAVSNRGRVKRATDGLTTHSGYVLKQQVNHKGYKIISIRNEDIKKSFLVHKLVFENFVKCVPRKMQINHKDHNKKNNNLSNLEIVTPRENIMHSFKHSDRNIKKGENAGTSKISNDEASEIRDLYQNTEITQKELSQKYGLSQPNISRVILRKSYVDA